MTDPAFPPSDPSDPSALSDPSDPPTSLPRDSTLFLGIGAQKSGTSWLNATLRQHPECHVPAFELHYFDGMFDATEVRQINRRVKAIRAACERLRAAPGPDLAEPLAEIRELGRLLGMYAGAAGDHSRYFEILLDGHAGQKVIGDITPSYGVLGEDGFRVMAATAPDTRFIFLMRDPVDRLWSSARQSFDSEDMSDADLYDRCMLFVKRAARKPGDRKLARSRYETTLAHLDAAVPAGRTLCLFYENLFTPAAMDRICGFLGIAPMQADFATGVNVGRGLKLRDEDAARIYDLLRPTYRATAARFGDALPDRWKARMAAFD